MNESRVVLFVEEHRTTTRALLAERCLICFPFTLSLSLLLIVLFAIYREH